MPRIVKRTHLAVYSIILCVVLALSYVSFVEYRSYRFRQSEDLFNDDKGADAISVLMPFAKAGDGRAQALVGYAYAYGWGGLKPNDETAIYWFRRCGACEPTMTLVVGEDPAAPHELIVSKVYATGEQATKPDLLKSRKWLVRAAEGGNREAISLLRKSDDDAGVSGPDRPPIKLPN